MFSSYIYFLVLFAQTMNLVCTVLFDINNVLLLYTAGGSALAILARGQEASPFRFSAFIRHKLASHASLTGHAFALNYRRASLRD